MIAGGIKIVRVRLPSQDSDLRLDLARSVIYRMDRWLAELMQPDNALVTIRSLGTVDSIRTRSEALAMLDARRSD